MPKTAQTAPRLGLALQGGGGHGAFTWGVLDRLLQESAENPDFDFDVGTYAGSSAGAMNAVIMAHGLMTGGPERARQDLAGYWRDIADFSSHLPKNPFLDGTWAGNKLADWLIYLNTEFLMHWLPWQRPVSAAPLKQVVERYVDFDRFREKDAPRIFINASDARRIGRARVFDNSDISAEAVVASAALPQLFEPVEIDGDVYYDGGLTRNPPLPTDREDLLAIAINAAERDEIPDNAMDLTARIQEIQLNAAFRSELSQIEHHNDRLDAGMAQSLPVDHPVRLHMVQSDGYLDAYSLYSRRMPDWSLFQALKERGREAAEHWLAAAAPQLGQRSTFRLETAEDASVRLADPRPLVPLSPPLSRHPLHKRPIAPSAP